MIRGTITVRLQAGVLDAEARAVEQALAGLGFDTLKSLRTARIFELELDAPDAQTARRALEDMARGLLANPVLETFHIEVG